MIGGGPELEHNQGNDEEQALSYEAAGALAKLLNFVYGLGVSALDIFLNVSREEGEKLLEDADKDRNRK